MFVFGFEGTIPWVYTLMILDSSAVEHPAVNRRVVGSNPTRGAFKVRKPRNIYGPLVKRLRHGPFTAETGVRFSYGSLLILFRGVAQLG